MNLILSALLGSGVGLSLGLLGGGGSILTVPILVYLLGISARAAITTSLLIVGATALMGAWFHHRRGNLRAVVGATFGGVGIVAAYGGSQLSKRFEESALLTLFALIMLVVAAAMWRGRTHLEKAQVDQYQLNKVILSGIGVGFLTGFLGVGGGFLIVPALVLFAGVPMKEAVGTSLLIIAINCAAGFVGHLANLNLNWTVTAAFTAGAIGGSFIGERIGRRLSPARLQKTFAVFIALVAVFLLVKNLGGMA
jgi:hypothetical protein